MVRAEPGPFDDLFLLLGSTDQPLFSAYKYFAQHSGGVALDEFLVEIDRLIELKQIRLFEPQGPTMKELPRCPTGLAERYRELGHDDATFDPLGYQLALGNRPPIVADPDWRMKIDWEVGTFSVDLSPGASEAAVMARIEPLFPGFRFERTRSDQEEPGTPGGGERIDGSVISTEAG